MVQKIHLSHFRNFEDRVFEFGSSINIVLGPNASGKTNILESIHLLATGKGFKTRITDEMITHNDQIGRVKGRVINKDGDSNVLEVLLTRGVLQSSSIQESVPKKKLLVDGVSKRLIDFSGRFSIVLFRPEDMDLVAGSPSLRRNYLDSILLQSDREYYRSLLSYEKGLRMRNKILLQIREEGISRNQLYFWDQLLIKNGDFISQKREEFLNFVNDSPQMDSSFLSIIYDKSVISPQRLQQYEREEVFAATTLVGPHRDDFILQMKDKNATEQSLDVAKYGSRGQQRMGVLWPKMAELSFLFQKKQQKPTLLLDDIFSELDHLHRDTVMQAVSGHQTIITAADPHFVVDSEDIQKINL